MNSHHWLVRGQRLLASHRSHPLKLKNTAMPRRFLHLVLFEPISFILWGNFLWPISQQSLPALLSFTGSVLILKKEPLGFTCSSGTQGGNFVSCKKNEVHLFNTALLVSRFDFQKSMLLRNLQCSPDLKSYRKLLGNYKTTSNQIWTGKELIWNKMAHINTLIQIDYVLIRIFIKLRILNIFAFVKRQLTRDGKCTSNHCDEGHSLGTPKKLGQRHP